jgi:hypothetical protein
MVASSTLKIEPVHVTLFQSTQCHLPGHPYQFSMTQIDSASLTDISVFLHVAIDGASNRFTAQFMLYCAAYFWAPGLLNAMK